MPANCHVGGDQPIFFCFSMLVIITNQAILIPTDVYSAKLMLLLLMSSTIFVTIGRFLARFVRLFSFFFFLLLKEQKCLTTAAIKEVIDHHHKHREASMALHQVMDNKGLRQPLMEDNKEDINNNTLLLKIVFTVF